jgi:hypothetical protein
MCFLTEPSTDGNAGARIRVSQAWQLARHCAVHPCPGFAIRALFDLRSPFLLERKSREVSQWSGRGRPPCFVHPGSARFLHRREGNAACQRRPRSGHLSHTRLRSPASSFHNRPRLRRSRHQRPHSSVPPQGRLGSGKPLCRVPQAQGSAMNCTATNMRECGATNGIVTSRFLRFSNRQIAIVDKCLCLVRLSRPRWG